MKTVNKEKIKEMKISFSTKKTPDSGFRLSQALSLLIKEEDLLFCGDKGPSLKNHRIMTGHRKKDVF